MPLAQCLHLAALSSLLLLPRSSATVLLPRSCATVRFTGDQQHAIAVPLLESDIVPLFQETADIINTLRAAQRPQPSSFSSAMGTASSFSSQFDTSAVEAEGAAAGDDDSDAEALSFVEEMAEVGGQEEMRLPSLSVPAIAPGNQAVSVAPNSAPQSVASPAASQAKSTEIEQSAMTAADTLRHLWVAAEARASEANQLLAQVSDSRRLLQDSRVPNVDARSPGEFPLMPLFPPVLPPESDIGTDQGLNAGYLAGPPPPSVAAPSPVRLSMLEAPDSEELSCPPVCTWSCQSAKCDQVCEPVCQPPKCETRCQGADTSQCVMDCNQPQCSVLCPKHPCPFQNCPQCKSQCSDPMCRLKCPQAQQCRNVCEQPSCEWDCKAPTECPAPQCRMVCESPERCKGESTYEALPGLQPGETAVQHFVIPRSLVVQEHSPRPTSSYAAAASVSGAAVRQFMPSVDTSETAESPRSGFGPPTMVPAVHRYEPRSWETTARISTRSIPVIENLQ